EGDRLYRDERRICTPGNGSVRRHATSLCRHSSRERVKGARRRLNNPGSRPNGSRWENTRYRVYIRFP
ncbi:hypothetical protein ACI0X1_001572, partial [Cronobacter sakazakii]